MRAINIDVERTFANWKSFKQRVLRGHPLVEINDASEGIHDAGTSDAGVELERMNS